MTTYRIGTDEETFICFPICFLMGGALIFLVVKKEDSAALVAAILFEIVFVVLLFIFLMFHFRKRYALKGEKSYGVIHDKEHERNGYFFYVIYKNMENNKACIKQQVSKETYYKFTCGDRISIHINGKYAAFNEEDLQKDLKNKRDEFVSVKNVLCNYCDKEYDNTFNRCPYCGAVKEI